MEKGKEGEGREVRGDVDILEDVVDAAATDCYEAFHLEIGFVFVVS